MIWDKNAIGGQIWIIATKEQKYCDIKVDFVALFAIMWSAKFTVLQIDRSKQLRDNHTSVDIIIDGYVSLVTSK